MPSNAWTFAGTMPPDAGELPALHQPLRSLATIATLDPGPNDTRVARRPNVQIKLKPLVAARPALVASAATEHHSTHHNHHGAEEDCSANAMCVELHNEVAKSSDERGAPHEWQRA